MSGGHEDGVGRFRGQSIAKGLLERDEDGEEERKRRQKEKEESLNRVLFFVFSF